MKPCLSLLGGGGSAFTLFWFARDLPSVRKEYRLDASVARAQSRPSRRGGGSFFLFCRPPSKQRQKKRLKSRSGRLDSKQTVERSYNIRWASRFICVNHILCCRSGSKLTSSCQCFRCCCRLHSHQDFIFVPCKIPCAVCQAA